MPRKKKNESEKQPLSQPENQPNRPKIPKKNKDKITDGSSITTDIGKLGELKSKIQREQAIKAAETAQQTQKEAEILSPASPLPSDSPGAAAFICSPIILDVSAGITFHVMRKIVNMFQKDLMPLSESQKEQVKGLLAYYAETYLPAALAKYQRAGDAIFVIGGILMMNTIDLRPPKEDKKPAEEMPAPPTLEEVSKEAPKPYQTGMPTLPSPAPVPRPEVQE